LKKQNNYININSGKYKGRRIELPNIETTRPSKSIVRNSIFDTLQNEIHLTTFVELFSGSGSVGFEAISRGASKTIFCEMNRTAIQTLQKNQRNFKNENIKIISGDTFSNLHQILQEIEKPAIFYIDPPFIIRDGMENIYKNSFKFLETIETKFVKYFIFEHISDEVMPENIGELSKIKSRKFGKTTISYYGKQ
jgi:16S rRNA (guanine(966)-N(2))-methyltransferase RsmD